ncbi:transposase [Pseudarthrobacter sp. AB1]|uniref:transposase n=1 Tax=Pseudarthrobacter sp. AB1 TaxID=2138309 RepID=UPI0035C9C4A2
MSRTPVLTDRHWARIQPLLPSSVGRRGPPVREDRRLVEGESSTSIDAGLPRVTVPAEFGPWQTIWNQHHRYDDDGSCHHLAGHFRRLS